MHIFKSNLCDGYPLKCDSIWSFIWHICENKWWTKIDNLGRRDRGSNSRPFVSQADVLSITLIWDRLMRTTESSINIASRNFEVLLFRLIGTGYTFICEMPTIWKWGFIGLIRLGKKVLQGIYSRYMKSSSAFSLMNRMAWQWTETLVEIRRTLADIRRTTKLGCRWNFPKHEFNRPVCLEAHHYLLAHLSQ